MRFSFFSCFFLCLFLDLFSFNYMPLLTFVSGFNKRCFLRCMEMWCLDDIGRVNWDWVEHASTPQSGVEAPCLKKRSLSGLYYCCLCVVCVMCCFTVSLFFDACDVTRPPRRKNTRTRLSLNRLAKNKIWQSRQLEAATFTGAVRGHSDSSSDSVADNGQLIFARGGCPRFHAPTP